MAEPVVGITCRHAVRDPKRTYHNIYPYDYQFTAFAERVARAGGIPVWLPNIAGRLEPAVYLERIDLLLLAGGEDVHPRHYGEQATGPNLDVSAPRDDFELPLIRAFWDARKPLAAICRGLQVLNVALGGTLYQDLSLFPNASPHTRDGREYLRTHPVRIIPGSRLARVCGGNELNVNTSHHQMIKDVAPGLRAVAWSAPDGLIEGLEAADDRPVLGVQWHPEMMDDAASERFFRQLIEL